VTDVHLIFAFAFAFLADGCVFFDELFCFWHISGCGYKVLGVKIMLTFIF
jgi:hypothetical protein